MMPKPPEKSVILAFPGPKARTPKPPQPPRNLGLTDLSKTLGPTALSPKGHWCERCEGIWYSHFGEARCPVCGSKS